LEKTAYWKRRRWLESFDSTDPGDDFDAPWTVSVVRAPKWITIKGICETIVKPNQLERLTA
jgi:hypothetical protein